MDPHFLHEPPEKPLSDVVEAQLDELSTNSPYAIRWLFVMDSINRILDINLGFGYNDFNILIVGGRSGKTDKFALAFDS